MIDREKVIRSLNNTLRHCHNLYNHVTNEEQIWLAEINQGAKDAIALLKKQPRWIPVEEKLPDKDGRYLVCDGGDVLEACFSLTGQLRRPEWYTTDCYEDESLDHVTHWVPLPEPPEENEYAES